MTFLRHFFSDVFRTFRTPEVLTVASRDLKEAELDLLQAQTRMEYSVSMLSYHTARVNRLRKLVGEAKPTQLRSVS